VNFGTERADTTIVRQGSESYFVRLNVDPPPGPSAPSASRRSRTQYDAGPQRSTARQRRKRRLTGKSVFIALLVIGLGTWGGWASQRPGGISGTVSSWISNVRGDVAKVSNDPDLAKARRYYIAQHTATNVYPQLSDSDLAAVGIGVGVNVYWCNPQAVVIQGASGGGTVSRLLLAGKDHGDVAGKFGCPANPARTAPWK
jgi:hypothetical protein